MLLDEEVWVTLNGTNIQYYKDLKYELPIITGAQNKKVIDIHSPFLVKVKDLPNNSHTKVKVQCDNCGKIYELVYGSYYSSSMKYNGNVYCNACAHSMFLSRENNPRWNPSITDYERENGRKNQENLVFIKKVLARDNYTCQCCGQSKDLNVHHLDGYNWAIDKRFDETNGITLCKKCHNNFHSIYSNGSNTKEQFLEWIGNKELNLSIYNGDIPNKRWIYCVEDMEIIKDVNNSNIRSCARGDSYLYKGKNYIYYDVYCSMSDSDKIDYVINNLKNAKFRPIICLNNKKIFKRLIECDRYAGIVKGVCSYLSGECKYAGHDPITNEELHWQYLSDYIIENNYSINDYCELTKYMTY